MRTYTFPPPMLINCSQINPFNKVPAFEDGDLKLVSSSHDGRSVHVAKRMKDCGEPFL